MLLSSRLVLLLFFPVRRVKAVAPTRRIVDGGPGWSAGVRWGCLATMAWLCTLLPLAAAEAGRSVLLIAGPPSHGPGLHEFPRGCALLAEALNGAGLPVRAEVSLGWPADATQVERADVVVLYSDGLAGHVARGKGDALRQRFKAGKALVVLHFALEPPDDDPELKAVIFDAVGGRFEAGWSVNPTWTVLTPAWPAHPVTQGLGAFEIEDEWYYHLRFREGAGVQPLLSVLPPVGSLGQDGPRSGNPAVRAALAGGEAQTLAWIATSPGGARGFGFTGGHFHRNWYQPAFRRLVVNGIVWAAGATVPEGGVVSSAPPAPVYPTIDESIARGDTADVARHLEADPALVNGKPDAKLRPLHQAILRRKPAIVELLLARGADPRLMDTSQRSPLQMAVERADAAIVELLLKRGADPKARDKAGWTALHHAGAKNQLAIARILLDGGADPNQRSELGGTSLHEAAVGGSVELIQLLLERGTDATVVSKTGVTALDLARQYKNEAVVRYLENRK
ncbi:MAG: ankyrin repeat domain-containing protein [Opitutaceae bacterium]